MSHKKNRRGLRCGMLVVTKRACEKKYGPQRWHTRCDCGGHRVIEVHNLNAALRLVAAKPQTIVSCGCSQYQRGPNNPQFVHGGRNVHKREYCCWGSMRGRCYNPKNPAYHNYGGRGITVCDRWREKGTGFLNFLADMGPRPDGMSIDRENVMGNYEPGNCRWADDDTQVQNRRCMYTPEQLAAFQRQADDTEAPPDVF